MVCLLHMQTKSGHACRELASTASNKLPFGKHYNYTRVRSPTPPIIIYSTMHMHAWFSRCILHVHTKNVFLLAWAKLQTTGRCFVKNSELMSDLRKVASGCSWAIGYGIDKIRCGPVAPAKKVGVQKETPSYNEVRICWIYMQMIFKSRIM